MHFISLWFFIYSLHNEQGDVYICGRKRAGLISDEEMSGLRIGLVDFVFNIYVMLFSVFAC